MTATHYIVEILIFGKEWMDVASYISEEAANNRQQFNEYELGVSTRVREKITFNMAFGALRF